MLLRGRAFAILLCLTWHRQHTMKSAPNTIDGLPVVCFSPIDERHTHTGNATQIVAGVVQGLRQGLPFAGTNTAIITCSGATKTGSQSPIPGTRRWMMPGARRSLNTQECQRPGKRAFREPAGLPHRFRPVVFYGSHPDCARSRPVDARCIASAGGSQRRHSGEEVAATQEASFDPSCVSRVRSDCSLIDGDSILALRRYGDCFRSLAGGGESESTLSALPAFVGDDGHLAGCCFVGALFSDDSDSRASHSPRNRRHR